MKWAKSELNVLKAQMAAFDKDVSAMRDMWKSGRYDDLLERSKELASLGEPHAMGYLARLYRDGKDVEADLEASEQWMRKSASGGVGWAQNELLDMLWKAKSYDEAFTLSKEYYEDGNKAAGARLGRCYRSGKGVEKDLSKAEECLRVAMDDGVAWARSELVEVLWSTGRYEEMVPLALEASKKDDPKACGYLGMAYRDGKGVPADRKRAEELLGKAASKNKSWSREIPKGD